MNNIKKIKFFELSMYEGKVQMPKGFEINSDVLISKLFQENLLDNKFRSSKEFDKVNSYIIEYMYVQHEIPLRFVDTWGNYYKSKTVTKPLRQFSPSFPEETGNLVALYGIDVSNCFIRLQYADSKDIKCSKVIELKKNNFVIFPASFVYQISSFQEKNFNFIQTIIYDAF
jgi:hypothetical protein|tara:strand:+ start:2467 stop:2979 length:513 start_codon:yes stop_codon:yes gene_type:complete